MKEEGNNAVEMKGSGVEWVGEVPRHWSTMQLCQALSCNNDSLSEDFDSEALIRYVDISSVSHVEGITQADEMKFVDAPTRARRKAMNGDVIVSTVRTYLKAVAQVTPEYEDCIYSTGFAVLRAHLSVVEPHYLKWMMLNDLLIQNIEANSEGLSYPAIKASALIKLKTVVPPFIEQIQISKYLDQATTRIDTLISKKTRLIELLKEKRKAVITKVVTKGLDDSVEMKDGGFSSVGMIPAHWDSNPVGHVLRYVKRTVGTRSSEFKLLSLTLNGVVERDISENFGKFPESFDTYQEVHHGDFVFCLFDMDETPRTVGRSGLLGMITGAYSVFKCTDPAYANYLLYLFLHLDNCKGLKPFYTGLRKTIRPPRFASIRIPFPPKHEAEAITKHLDYQTRRIEILITKTQRSIELLKEKRSALITAAVTGKIDIREAA